jgi:hypothetical protein
VLLAVQAGWAQTTIGLEVKSGELLWPGWKQRRGYGGARANLGFTADYLDEITLGWGART